jgi:hypothetical protein
MSVADQAPSVAERGRKCEPAYSGGHLSDGRLSEGLHLSVVALGEAEQIAPAVVGQYFEQRSPIDRHFFKVSPNSMTGKDHAKNAALS